MEHSPIEEPLLGNGSSPRKLATGALGVAAFVAFGFAGCLAFGVGGPNASTPLLKAGAIVNVTALSQDLGAKSCWTNTGGTCNIFSCSAKRGPTNCESRQCYCQEGYCAGSDGHCYKEQNTLVASGFTIRNQKWPDSFLYTASCDPGSLYISKEPQGDKEKFFMYQLPPHDGKEKTYMLGSLAYPDCLWWVFEMHTKYSHVYSLQDSKPNMAGGGVDNHAFKIKPVGDGSYTFEHLTYGFLGWGSQWVYYYVGQFGSSLTAWGWEPGAQGHWIFEPPIPGLGL